jgi:cytochrome c1
MWIVKVLRIAALSLALSLVLPPMLGGSRLEAQTAGPSLAGHPKQGARLIKKFGCGACHSIPGIEGADGLVGPPLTHMGSRVFLAGVLRNTPDNMVTWLLDPQRVVPNNAMPDVGLTERQARDITAYLQSLK